MHLLSFLLALVCCLSCSHGRSELDMLRVAYSNVEKDTIDGEVSLESGEIPHWLNGTFIRHSCGVFGETESDLNSPIVNYVDHLFDCLEMGTSFKFEDGKVSFYNRYYDTNHVDIFNAYNQNINESKVFWKTILAEFDVEQNTNLRENITAGPKVAMIDHVAWWRIGDRVAAYSEGAKGFWMDIHNVEYNGRTDYKDTIMGYPMGTMFVSNPAHPHIDPDGTVWSACLTYVPVGPSGVYSSRYTIYTIVDETRSVVGEITLGEVDLSVCAGDGEPYPDLDHRQGYMHSFAMTENYIILPTSAYLYDPCVVAENYRPELPFFKASFKWYDEHDSILYVVRRSDGQLMASIPTTAFFVTHQLNSYEQDGSIYVDTLLYANADIYTYNMHLEQIFKDIPYETYVERFTIDMEDWTLRPFSPKAALTR
ncbi:hypothetical protein CAPTEDRAFT_194807 [Capitella teleta]|uniref:Olfactomedin-like domain-containing protein n=1 Tax=Capitella teleta TaxID=283909 RepID=R7US82_CAPTE|nr:hypothetical protein CAPTEDRAFT_194807 [Capitella teleta]|eukprot:ELU09374.1 hypothetical protein CAPTEDRAFT_194807 [Capitella teleta]